MRSRPSRSAGFRAGLPGQPGERSKKDIDAAAAVLQTQLETARSELQATTDKAGTLPVNTPERIYAEAQRNILINQITNLNNRLSVLNSSAVTAGQIITNAPLPPAPDYPIPALNLGAGLLGGLLLGLGLALLIDRFDHRLRNSGDIQRRLHVPVLAQIPRSKKSVPVPGSEHVAAFTRLRHQLGGGEAAPAHPGQRSWRSRGQRIRGSATRPFAGYTEF